LQGFGGAGAGGLDGAGILVPQRVHPGGGQRQFLAQDALYFAYPGVGIELGYGEKLVAGLFDGVFHPQPVEQRAWVCCWWEVSSIRRRAKWRETAGRCILTYDRANLWSDPCAGRILSGTDPFTGSGPRRRERGRGRWRESMRRAGRAGLAEDRGCPTGSEQLTCNAPAPPRSSPRLRRFKCSTATLKISASDLVRKGPIARWAANPPACAGEG